MPRRTQIKSYGQGGRTRGRHKNWKSSETRIWNRMMRQQQLKGAR